MIWCHQKGGRKPRRFKTALY